MLRPESPVPGSPADWLRHAKADLVLATVNLPEGGLYSTLCFHAQQAVEKSIKAVLVAHGIQFAKIHSITRLIDLLPNDIPRDKNLLQSALLTPYATTFRYPAEDDAPDISQEQYAEAIRLANMVLVWAEKTIKS